MRCLVTGARSTAELGYHPGDIDTAILDAAPRYEQYLPL